MRQKQSGIFSLPVIVGALGFFVDIYDLLLFSIVRRSSFAELGVHEENMQRLGQHVISWQMVGLAIGGIVWGILGDKKGRKNVLFGSIILYSLATIANGFVVTIEQYKWLRFIAGLGLAGELGASITLVSELLPKEKRGIGSAIIATSGVLGQITAYLIYKTTGEDWRLCYFIGGGMGIALLFLRMKVLESRMYDAAKIANVQMGNFFMFFTSWERFVRYMRAIFIGLPVWYVIGLLMTFAEKFATRFGINDFDQPRALMLQYAGLAFGDMCAGLISNYIKSRKKTLLIYYGILSVFIILFFAFKGGGSAFNMYLMCIGLGFGAGISVLYITMSAEQFGTNLRASAAISVPNMVRVFTPVIYFVFQLLGGDEKLPTYISAAWITGAIVMLTGFIAVLYTKETFGKEMNFVEV
jgi:MFS transporter, putative metabolite:H+ symporter